MIVQVCKQHHQQQQLAAKGNTARIQQATSGCVQTSIDGHGGMLVSGHVRPGTRRFGGRHFALERGNLVERQEYEMGRPCGHFSCSEFVLLDAPRRLSFRRRGQGLHAQNHALVGEQVLASRLVYHSWPISSIGLYLPQLANANALIDV
jgi:hypothetical protein